ncbi:unnamed protein product [Arctogadus glacialis]
MFPHPSEGSGIRERIGQAGEGMEPLDPSGGSVTLDLPLEPQSADAGRLDLEGPKANHMEGKAFDMRSAELGMFLSVRERIFLGCI